MTFRLKNSNQRLIFSFQPYTYLNALYIKITNQLSIQNNLTRSSSLRNTSDYIYIIRHNPHFVKYYFEPTEIRNSNTYESLIIFFSSVISIPFCAFALSAVQNLRRGLAIKNSPYDIIYILS